MVTQHGRRWALVWTALLLGGTLAAGAAQAGQRKPDVHFVPTPHELIQEMLKAANVTRDDVVYDLGCGDGRIVITAVGKFGAHKGVGIDIDPQRIKESHEEARKANVADRVTFLEQDLYDTDFSDATVVSLYLLPALNVRLRPILFRQLRPGDRIVSHAFQMGDWLPDKTLTAECPDGAERTAYFWVLPAGVAGTWKAALPGPDGDQPCEIRLAQCFQTVRGTVKVADQELPIAEASLTGDRLEFRLVRKTGDQETKLAFRCRIAGHTLTGTLENSGGPAAGPREWTATRVPVNLVGTWNWTQGDQTMALRVDRRDGRSYGALVGADKRSTRLPHFYVWGSGVYFLVETDPKQTFEGVADGDRIVGTVTGPDGKAQPWTAQRKP